jgi:5-methylcytosine-specific restriction endonuclease McrA
MGMGRMVALIEKEEGLICHYCKKPLKEGKITVDHVVPRKLGGRDTLENLVLACQTCNSQKRDKSLATFLTLRKLEKLEVPGVRKIALDDEKFTLVIDRGVKLKKISKLIDPLL